MAGLCDDEGSGWDWIFGSVERARRRTAGPSYCAARRRPEKLAERYETKVGDVCVSQVSLSGRRAGGGGGGCQRLVLLTNTIIPRVVVVVPVCLHERVGVSLKGRPYAKRLLVDNIIDIIILSPNHLL